MGSCATKCCATKCCATTSSSGEPPVFADKSSSVETPVFPNDGYDFRIPALLYVKEWTTFLAFAEKRSSTNDADAKNLVMSKGTRQTDGSLQWSLPKDLMTALKPGYRSMNPCPVFERISKTLFLFFICIEGNIPENELKPGQTRLCYITSPDCGVTWSELTDLTSRVNFTNYKTFAVGPGHGIQLSSGTEALLVPAYVKVNCGTHGVKSYSVVLRSEDMHTWKAGQPVIWQVGQPLGMESGECQLAEVCDGKGGTQVYLNARSTKALKPQEEPLRVEAVSDDSGESFKLKKLTLKESNRCQGSVLGFPARELSAGEGGSSETALLFSHPTTEDRQNLGVYLRKSLQDPWVKHLIIHKGASGYSDLTYCEKEGHFGCLMESGKGEVSQRLRIAFREFKFQGDSLVPCV